MTKKQLALLARALSLLGCASRRDIKRLELAIKKIPNCSCPSCPESIDMGTIRMVPNTPMTRLRLNGRMVQPVYVAEIHPEDLESIISVGHWDPTKPEKKP